MLLFDVGLARSLVLSSTRPQNKKLNRTAFSLRIVGDKTKKGLKVYWALLGLAVMAIALSSNLSYADNPQEKNYYTISVPPMNAAEALNLLAEQTGVTFLFPYKVAEAQQANPVVGRFTLSQALELLLKGSTLSGGLTDSGVVIISQKETKNGEGMGMHSKKNLLAATVAFFVGGGSALAQEVEAEKSTGFMLEEVVVTAQKRQASLQDVPISVSAFTGDRLANAGIENSLELVMVTPGLSMSGSNQFSQLFIRGIGSTALQGPGADPSSAVYLDGVYQSRFTGALIGLLDLERVEVLKGPQGTLYGRNATAGAIKYISKEPTSEFSGRLSQQLGNYDLVNTKVQLNTPLIDDLLLFRGSVQKITRDGFTENLLIPGDEVDYLDVISGRFSVKYMPHDDLDIILHASLVNDDGAPGPARKTVLPENSGLLNDAERISDERKIKGNQRHNFPARHRSVGITAKWTMENMLLTAITGYTDERVGPLIQDYDATEIPLFQQGQQGIQDGYLEDTQTFSQEILLSSIDSGVLEWTAGVYYLHDKPGHVTGFTLPIFGDDVIRFIGDATIDAYAAFGHLSYNLTDNLRLNVGLRYSYEEKQLELSQTFNGEVTEFSDRSEDWSSWTPKFGVDYFLNEDTMLYFSATKGFKSGAYNTSGFEDPVDPEFIYAYEVGVKSMLLDGRVRFNVAAFTYDYEDLQVFASDIIDGIPTGVLQNAAEAEVTGLEVDINALITENFQVDLGLSWLDAEFGEYFAVDPETGDEVNLKGNDMPMSPDFTANLGMQYTVFLNGLGELSARTDIFHSGERFFNQFNNQARSDEYTLVNARVSLESLNEKWEFAVFGKNLTDELVAESGETVPSLLEDAWLRTIQAPRTYGVEVKYSF